MSSLYNRRARFRIVVMGADDTGYEWLETTQSGAAMQVASCFGFYSGLTLADIVDVGGLGNVRTEHPIASRDPTDAFPDWKEVAIFEGGDGWTVSYQQNGMPNEFAENVARSTQTQLAVIIYWNVEVDIEFAYWENGTQVVRFDDVVEDRRGSDPDRLIREMAETVGLTNNDSDEPAVKLYEQLLALADRLTGLHLPADFLHNRSLLIGTLS